MAGWRRCDRCRRVLPTDEYDGDSPTCRACLALPTKPPRGAGAAPVTRSRTSPRAPRPAPAAAAPAGPPGPRAALLGVTGSGDLEVRERRARRAAQDALVESHPEEFALLLRDARLKEGLRDTSAPAPGGAGDPDGGAGGTTGAAPSTPDVPAEDLPGSDVTGSDVPGSTVPPGDGTAATPGTSPA